KFYKKSMLIRLLLFSQITIRHRNMAYWKQCRHRWHKRVRDYGRFYHSSC
uniref:Uncharacterized protein n=1 Tax=Aegilops tauschii subsp. strangulata TaxID=200361 RepID=A0A453ERB1_AEGTS